MWMWLKSHLRLVIGSVLVVVGLWYFFGRPRPVTYDEYTVGRGRVVDTLELSGKLTAGVMATLRFPAGGLVTYLGAKEGDTVQKWQTLASIDTRQLQKTLEQKLNLYSIQRGTFDQTLDDNDNSVPAGDLEQTLKRLLEKNQFQLDNTVKDVEYLHLSLQLARLTTPLSGVLIQSPVTSAGTQVLASESWIVVDPSTLYLSADLDETDLKRVSIGQPVEITLDAYPDLGLDSTVSSIAFSPKETTSGTTYEVKLILSPTSIKELRLGLNGTAAIILTKKENVLTLPSSALTPKNGGYIVFVKSGNKYKEQAIETGIENDGVVEILGGVGEADHVYAEK